MEFPSIQLATPFPWGQFGDPSVVSRSRKRKGSGVQYLQRKISRGEVSEEAHLILQGLLPSSFDSTQGEDGEGNDPYPSDSLPPLSQAIEERKALPVSAESSWTDEETVRNAPEISLLCTILSLIDRNHSGHTGIPESAKSSVKASSSAGGLSVLKGAIMSTTTTTRQIIRECCLCVNPGTVPANMDAKEMTIAALLFLSSDNSSDILSLPLIQSTTCVSGSGDTIGDMEKRSFRKFGDWNVRDPDFLRKLRWLETIFLEGTGGSDYCSSKNLPREKYCPRIPQEEEVSLLLKGSIPASAMPAKPKKGSSGNKRKSPSST